MQDEILVRNFDSAGLRFSGFDLRAIAAKRSDVLVDARLGVVLKLRVVLVEANSRAFRGTKIEIGVGKKVIDQLLEARRLGFSGFWRSEAKTNGCGNQSSTSETFYKNMHRTSSFLTDHNPSSEQRT